MHEATTPRPKYVLDEGHRGCVRVRLHRLDASEPLYLGVEISARRGRSGQFKLLNFASGLAEREARAIFAHALAVIEDFNWKTGEVVPRAGNP